MAPSRLVSLFVAAVLVLAADVRCFNAHFDQGGFNGLPDDSAMTEGSGNMGVSSWGFSHAEGLSPGHVVIEEVVSYPGEGHGDRVVLRNIGGTTVDLTGWQLSDAEGVKRLVFGDDHCSGHVFLSPTDSIELTHKSLDSPCLLPFTVGYRDSMHLSNKDDEVVAQISWESSQKGTCFRRQSDGSYIVLKEESNIPEILEEMGQFSEFLNALKVLGLDKKLGVKSDPDYQGTHAEYLHNGVGTEPLTVPAWYGFDLSVVDLDAPPVETKLPEGIPKKGPFTVFAPTNGAFDRFRLEIAGQGNPAISVEDMLALPEFKHIMLYHILPGLWTSKYFRDHQAMDTAKGVSVVAFSDASMGEGKVQLHDACVDKPTPDPFSCKDQSEFGKCSDPFMTSSLAADWRGGFCELTCKRCTCDPREGFLCAQVVDLDIMASNGAIHSIDRLILPPPPFEKKVAAPVGGESTTVNEVGSQFTVQKSRDSHAGISISSSRRAPVATG